MATYTLKITLNSADIAATVKELNVIEKQFKEKCIATTKVTADNMKRFIDLQYATATNYIGTSTVSVDVTPIESGNGHKVTGSGPELYFLEYGTGKYAGQGQPSGSGPVADVDKTPGSWSQTYGKGWYIPGNREYWVYGRTIITGSYGAWAFPYASIYSSDFISEAIQEVFGE